MRNRIILGVRGAGGHDELAKIRIKALEITDRLAQGLPPEAEPALASSITFRELFDERMRIDTSISTKTRLNYEVALRNDVLPAIGDKPANSISKTEVSAVLRAIKSRSPGLAKTALSAIAGAYSFGNRRGVVSGTPTSGLDFTPPKVPRRRVFSDAEIGRIWLAIPTARATDTMRHALKLLLLLPTRESELAGAEATELDFNAGLWRIPPTRMVGGRLVEGRMKRKSAEQVLPLSIQAAATFKEAIAANNGSTYVFVKMIPIVKNKNSIR